MSGACAFAFLSHFLGGRNNGLAADGAALGLTLGTLDGAVLGLLCQVKHDGARLGKNEWINVGRWNVNR